MLGDLAYWIPDAEEAWVKADLVSVDEKTAEVTVTDPRDKAKVLKFAAKAVHTFDPTHSENFQDLCKMNDLHEAPLLNLLKMRYMQDEIYTTAGSMILVSVNPYKSIPGLYDAPLQYLDLPEGDEELVDDTVPPHVYKVANQTLYSMASYEEGPQKSTRNTLGERHMNQSIIVSGESGAGKTEASKKVMNFLVAANIQLVQPAELGDDETENEGAKRRASTRELDDALGRVALKIQDEILGSNFIFESFGNAKTVRNDNSSRFGKYIKLQYTGTNQLVSAYTDTFLLEKSRLLNVSTGESNYHVLYQVIAGAASGELAPELASKLKLSCSSPEEGFKNFKILSADDGEAYWRADESGQEFSLSSLRRSLDATGFTEAEQEGLWTILAIILHLGNSTLGGGPDSDEGGRVTMDCPSMPIPEIAALLGLEEDLFLNKMTLQEVRARGRSSVAVKELSVSESKNNINGYMKMLYSSLFSYVVHKINYSHSCLGKSTGLKAKKFIGILDIFGFEIMLKNSFEQLCINFANERLQQHFNKNVFEKEKQEYTSQGIDASFVTYADNQGVIDLLLQKPDGLFTMMNDLAKVNKKDDSVFLQQAHNSHSPARGKPPPPPGSASARYEMVSVTKRSEFRVRHFAGTVTYTVGSAEDHSASFLEKNNDSLQESLQETVVLSSNVFLNNVGGLEIGFNMGEVGSPGYVPKFTKSGMAIEEDEGVDEDSELAERPSSGGDRVSISVRPASRHLMASAHTVSSTFIRQVDDLMKVLRETEPHYIKCMKPNGQKTQQMYNGPLMLEQLTYSGVLEVVRIRREGYPWNARFAIFYANFDLLSTMKQLRDGWPTPAELSKEDEETARDYCVKLLAEYMPTHGRDNADLYALGTTRVYLKEEGFNVLQMKMTGILDNLSTLIQKHIRRIMQMRWYRGMKKWAVLHQRLARGKVKRAWFKVALKEKKDEEARLAAIAKAKEEERLRQEAIAKAKKEAEEAELARLEAEAEAARLAEEARIKAEEEEKERQRLAAIAAEEERLRLIEEEKQRIIKYHEACLHGDLETVRSISEEYPTYAKKLRPDKPNKQRLPLASACCSGILPTIQYLNPSPKEIFFGDSTGCNAFLQVCEGPELEEGDLLSAPTQILPSLQYILRAASESYPLEEAFDVISVHTKRDGKEHDSGLQHNAMRNRSPVGAIMKEGYLSKKHESMFSVRDAQNSNAWVKRWVRLTDEAIYYFRDEESSHSGIPRDTISFTKNMGTMQTEYYTGAGGLPAVKIVFSAASGQKKRTALNLMANDKKEMDEWSRPLKQLSGMLNGEFQPTPTVLKMNRVEALESKSLMQSKNKNGDRGMHLLARRLPELAYSAGNSYKGPTGENLTTQVVTAIAWMVSCGCYIDEKAGDGKTVLDIALEVGNLEAALAFAKLGAQVTQTHGKIVQAKISAGVFSSSAEPFVHLREANAVYLKGLLVGATDVPPKPPKLPTADLKSYQRNLYMPRYSYLTIHFQSMVLEDAVTGMSSVVQSSCKYKPTLKVSLLDHDNLVEHFYAITLPVIQHKPLECRSDADAKGLPPAERYIWWGKSVHIDTPIDYLPDGCHFKIEYRRDFGVQFPTNIERVTTYTLDFVKLRTTSSTINLPLAKPGGEDAPSAYLECEVVVSKQE